MSQGLMAEESESEVVEERREHRRVEVELPVRIQAPVRTEGKALELSEGGLRIEIDEDLTHAMHISLEVELPTLEQPVGTLADIRWHEKMGPKADPRWIYGLRFTELDEREEAAIVEYIDQQM
jgi:c-di-GMP-binding flagellar brake protein YcgR